MNDLEQIKIFHSILSDYDTVMLICNAGDKLNARPMAIAHLEDNCDLWFFTADHTEKTEELKNDSRTHITCQKDHGSYLSLSGTATVSHDRAKMKELWKESFRVWFPKGIDELNIALINVKAETGEYWDNRGAKGISYIFKALSSYISGTTPNMRDGEDHGKVQL